MKKIRWGVLAGSSVAGMGLAVLALIWSSHLFVEKRSDRHVYFGDQEVSPREVGMVLGCSRYLANGRENLFFKYRIDRAVELYRQGAVKYLLVSGDNTRSDYDETTEMRKALMERGIPDEAIVSDFAGIRTLDSVVRARQVFGQDSLIVISQEFHVRRAIVIGEAHGVEVLGAVAQEVSGSGGIKTHLREYLARVQMLLDLYVLNRKPRFLGDPIEVGKHG